MTREGRPGEHIRWFWARASGRPWPRSRGWPSPDGAAVPSDDAVYPIGRGRRDS